MKSLKFFKGLFYLCLVFWIGKFIAETILWVGVFLPFPLPLTLLLLGAMIMGAFYNRKGVTPFGWFLFFIPIILLGGNNYQEWWIFTTDGMNNFFWNLLLLATFIWAYSAIATKIQNIEWKQKKKENMS
jgi:hypothetical protein